MKNFASRLQQHLLLPLCLCASLVPTADSALGSVPQARISNEISNAQMTVLPGSQHPLAQAKFESGRLAAGTKIQGISLYFSRTQAQEADLQTLLAAQQNSSSAQYHKWLTPDQFAARFGMSDSDLAKVKSWLEAQGFSIDSIARSRNLIRFSGSVAQVESTFATEMHHYTLSVRGVTETHFAPSTALSLPAALAGVVQAVHNLDDFRPHSHAISGKSVTTRPAFTSSQTQNVFFAPGDITTVYDVQKMYNAGYTGTGQTIAIVGQSEVEVSDLEAFQNAAGLTVKDPTILLMPGTGSSTPYSGDESESDLDLEWSSAIAKGADLTFVYTGSNTNYGTFDALEYAIDNRLANIISNSYGSCETELGGVTLESFFAQAASQGQTIIAASGDDGSTDCFAYTNLTTAQQEALAVDYPASSPYVTGLGGTEISTASSTYLTSGSAYWEAASGSDVIASALQYIPEQAWNEDTAGCGQTDCLDSGGGGASALFAKPSWQTGVTGIPSDAKRDVPDISLNASTGLPGYLFCTSDTSFWASTQVASCNSGFRDSTSGLLTYAGGTSFAAPIFSGMLALINQQQNYPTGQGLINPILYTLAADSTTYASAFHDITSGDNDCRAGSSFCSGVIGFSAGTGYDQATGLGSIDLYNLANAWPANTGTILIGTTTTVSASNSAPLVGASDTFTITVVAASGTTTPTGTVSITVDSGTAITGNALTANGTFTYTTSFSTAGSHTIIAAYSGDATYAASTGTVSVNATVTSSGTGSFTVAATNVTVTQGNVGTSTVTVTPSGGYTGTVQFALSTSSSDIQNDTCFTLDSAVVSGTAPVTQTLTIDTCASSCLAQGAVRKSQNRMIRTAGIGGELNGPNGPITAISVLAGLLLAGLIGRYARRLRVLAVVILLATVGMAFTGCGGSSSSSVQNAPKGTYTLTITGTDSSSSSIPVATSTFTLTIQ